jgi:hypothetical protein
MPLGHNLKWYFDDFKGMGLDIILSKDKKEELSEIEELTQAFHLFNDLDEHWYTESNTATNIFGIPIAEVAFKKKLETAIKLIEESRKHEQRIENLGKEGLKILTEKLGQKTNVQEIKWFNYAEQIKERLRLLLEDLRRLKKAAESKQRWPWPNFQFVLRSGQEVDPREAIRHYSQEILYLTNAIKYSFKAGHKLGILPKI